MTRPSWGRTFLDVAEALAQRCTCPRARALGGVGAVLVESETHRVLGVGYAGSPPGTSHCDDVGCLVLDADGGCRRTVHAEMNAILFARRSDRTKVLYSTVSPCIACLVHAITIGVRRVVYRVEYRIVGPQVDLCAGLGVSWEQEQERR